MTRRWVQLAELALLSISGITATAAAQQYVGVSKSKFDYHYAKQENSQWCWAASIQMILKYYGVEVSQEEIVRRSYGMDPWGKLPDWPGSWQVITANLNNWSVDDNGQQYVVRAWMGVGAPNPAVLVNELKNQKPILLAYMSSPNSGHAVVGTAASYTPPAFVNTVVVRDPWPSSGNIGNKGRAEYDGAVLAQMMRMYWIVRVSASNANPSNSSQVPTPANQTANGPPILNNSTSKQGSLKEALKSLVSSAPSGFASFRGSFDYEDQDSKVYRLTMNVPGTTECLLWESKDDDAPYVRCKMGNSDDDYDKAVSAVRGALLGWTFSEDNDDSPQSSYFARKRSMDAVKDGTPADISVVLLERAKNGNIAVSLSVNGQAN